MKTETPWRDRMELTNAQAIRVLIMGMLYGAIMTIAIMCAFN